MIPAEGRESWGSHFGTNYVRLRRDADPKALEPKLSALMKDRLPEEKISLILQPLSKIRLYAEDGTPVGMKYIYIFSVIAFFILAIACINFINLSTARSEKRAKEVGLRKVAGADRDADTDVLINETAARFMETGDPVGRTFAPGPRSRWTIIGVVRDFHSAWNRTDDPVKRDGGTIF